MFLCLPQPEPHGAARLDFSFFFTQAHSRDLEPETGLGCPFDPRRWQEFRRRYQSEIQQHPEQFDRLRTLAQHGRITLVSSARDEVHNDAVLLKDLLLGRT